MQLRSTKEQGQYDDLVEEFKKKGGEVSKGLPALAKGSEATRVLKQHVTKVRAAARRGDK